MTTATIAALFSPVPAMAAPPPAAVPAVPPIPAVPDSGSRPTPLGSLVLPGQTTSTPSTILPSGLPTTPALAAIEKARADVALLGDRLITLGEERDLAAQQAIQAERKVGEAQTAVENARQAANTAASDAFKDAAALPPGTIGSNLHGLGALAGIQRGEPAGEQAAGRQLTLAQEAQQAALVESSTAGARSTDLATQYSRLATQHQQQQTALLKLEQAHATEIAAGEAAEQAQDAQLGAGYTGGDSAEGKAADPRALAALNYALAQRGDPYVWSEEGPDKFDCSGLMWAAYRTPAAGSKTLPRVSRDQYNATRANAVDRYSLLPGDLLFFSSSNSWTGIHHVAMYAGNGMMVEAPRSGLNVRLTTVRWTRLFQATRVYGPVDGPSRLPDLNPAPPRPSPSASPSPSRTTQPPPPPSPSPSQSSSSPSPSNSGGSPSPSTSSPSPSASASTSTSQPTPTPSPTTSSSTPAPGTSAPSTGTSSSASSRPPATTSSAATSSAATKPSSASATSSAASASASKAAG